MLEPIQGESGVHAASAEYLKGARKLCDDHGLLLIFDEVQTGMGRTGKLWGYQLYDVIQTWRRWRSRSPAVSRWGACLARGDAADTFQPGDHASTFGGNALACAAAIATIS